VADIAATAFDSLYGFNLIPRVAPLLNPLHNANKCLMIVGVDDVFQNRVLRRIFGPKKKEMRVGGENCITRSFIICTLRQG
jgi:hypothetical protein